MLAIEHAEELRKRLILVLVFFAVLFVAGVALSRFCIGFATGFISGTASLVVLSPLEYLLSSLKIGFFVATVFSLPFAAYQAALFFRPALVGKEKRLSSVFMPCFLVLYLAGLVFSFLFFVPLALYFLALAPSIGIQNLWSLSNLINFVFFSTLGSVLVFQIPVVMIILKSLNLADVAWLSGKRKHVYVAVFILAAVLTPGVDV
ncbi:MAG: twin-arginine translocase subunit TatC, partial [Candidatus Woesearchaeota archaeon]